MSLLSVCICASFFYSNIEANIDVDQFFQPVQQMLACTATSSYQFLSKEFTFIGCATTCAALYGGYALSQRFMSPTTVCALLLSGYVCYKYHADEEIKNLFVDATNFINMAITTTTRETHERLHVIDEQTRRTNHALLLLEIQIKAQAMQERIKIQTKFNKIEQKIQQQSDRYYLDMSQKLVDLEHRLDQKLIQAEHNIQTHITQTMHTLLAQNKQEIINTSQQEAAQIKKEQKNLELEIHNAGTSASLQSHELGRCINALMHQLELTNQNIVNTQNMIQELAQAAHVQIASSSPPHFELTECKIPNYEPLVHNALPECLESDHKEDTLEDMINVIKEQEEAIFAQQKKEIQQSYGALQTQLLQERATRKQEFDILIKKHKTQTAKKFKTARQEALAQQQQTQEQIDQEFPGAYQPISDGTLFARKASLMSSTIAYARNIRTLLTHPFTSILLLLQNVSCVDENQ